MYPQLTAGNNFIYQYVYTANIISIDNNGSNGKTKLTVSVTRIDSYTGNRTGAFLLLIENYKFYYIDFTVYIAFDYSLSEFASTIISK